MTQRNSFGLIFDCPSPSVWNLVGAPVMLAFDGAKWIISMVNRDGQFCEGHYQSRDEATRFLARCFKILT
jgi:hypothetical protein